MGLFNSIACGIRSLRIKDLKEFYKRANDSRDVVKRVEVRGEIIRRDIGLGEATDYYSYLIYHALNNKGQLYFKYKVCLGRDSTCLGMPAGKEGLPLIDSNLELIENRILKQAKKYEVQDLVKVMFAEQIGA